MLMNHSCNPTTIDDSHDDDHVCVATRDIKKGDELTANYALEFYDRGCLIKKCLCGSSNCLGQMMGFKALSDENKAKYLPMVSRLMTWASWYLFQFHFRIHVVAELCLSCSHCSKQTK
jgi:hypothetical protein